MTDACPSAPDRLSGLRESRGWHIALDVVILVLVLVAFLNLFLASSMLTLILVFVAAGIVRAAMGIELRPLGGWGWAWLAFGLAIGAR